VATPLSQPRHHFDRLVASLDQAEEAPDAFACGHRTLDIWLKQHARPATRQGTRTYVLIEEATGAVVGYFALAPHLVERDETPRRMGRGAPRRIPAILLAKLALDAIDENAASFYCAHDFQPSPADPHRLIVKLSTAARALGLTWP
jgi:hypothetical protein